MPGTDKDFLSTAQAARLAGVGTTSIKRWADMGLLPYVRTAGGHRRFAREELLRFLQEREGTQQMQEGTVRWWVDLLVNGPLFDVQSALLTARGQMGAWYRVMDTLGMVLTHLGELWETGELSVAQEHVASEKLHRALTHISTSLPLSPQSPVALLVCPEGEEHTLGLALAELTLRECGWHTEWLGHNTPLEEIERVIHHNGLALVALSASVHQQDTRLLNRVSTRLGDLCREQKLGLVMGGEGPWPTPLPHGHRIHTFAHFHRYLGSMGERLGR